jgi:hypothetical protein
MKFQSVVHAQAMHFSTPNLSLCKVLETAILCPGALVLEHPLSFAHPKQSSYMPAEKGVIFIDLL